MADNTIISQLKSQINALENKAPLAQKPGASPRKRSQSSSKKATQKDFSSAEEALNKIVALLNASDKSEHAIRERLMQAGFEQPAIENALERAKAYGFIDDHRYADVLIRSRLSQGKGIQGIIRELASQQIDIEEVPGWPEEFEIDEDRELERALAFLERKPPRSKNQREGAYRKLMGGGFSSSVASSAARIWAKQRPDTRF